MRKNQKSKSVLIVCLALALWSITTTAPAQAQDVPPYLVHQGRLMDALNAPLSGVQDLTFNLYAEETAGTSFWTETQAVSLTEGFYSVTLGQGQALDLAQFSGATLYLGVTVGGEELAPRLALRSVPYAIKAGTSQTALIADTALTADNVTGDITPSSVTVGGTVIDSTGITVNGATVIDGTGQWAGPAPVADYNTLLNPPFTFDNLNCLNGDVAQFVGGAWTCTPASSADTLSGLGCAEGQTAKFVAGAWTCGDDADTDTTYSAGNGITIGAANDIAADTTVLQNRVFGTCSAGFSIRQVNADGSVVCEDDSDTTYLAGAGVTITGANNTVAVDTTAIQGRVSGVCVVGESIRQINEDGTVVCEPDTDTDTDTTYSADPTGGLTLSGTNAFGIAANAITSARIADGTITGADLAANAITSAHILDATVTSADIANATITAADTDTASVQARVTGVCPAGSSISAISAAGTVTCEADDNPTYALGDRVIFAQDAEQIRLETNTGTGFLLMNETSATRGGNVRVGFDAYIQSGPDYWAWQITVDGAPVASGPFSTGLNPINTASVHLYRRYQVDLSNVTPGARIAVYMKASDSAGNGAGTGIDQRLFMKRFRVYANQPTKEGGVQSAATWRGRITDASRTAVVGADGGFAQFEALEDGNADVFEVITTGTFGVRFKRAGHLMWQYDQDIISGGAGNYPFVRARITNKYDHYSLIRPTAGLWDSINNGGVAQVTPGDVLTFEFGCSGCDITAMDSAGWSNLSLFWMGSLDP